MAHTGAAGPAVSAGPAGPTDLLAAWEAGLAARHDGDRALLLHRVARPDSSGDELLSLPVGEREADLLALRRALFGDRMQVLVECRACGEAMEFDLDAGELAQRPRRPAGPLRVEADGWVVEFRLPTVADLAAAAAAAAAAGAAGRTVAGAAADEAAAGSDGGAGTGLGAAGDSGTAGADAVCGDTPRGLAAGADAAGAARVAARQALLARCTLSAVRAGEPVPADRLSELPALLPEAVQLRLAEAAGRADPAAELTLNVACPECGEATPAELDIASYLWTELDAWARDLLLDVHLLATAYGWSEPEILALSPLRRRYYLELCADA
ncbi:T4 family baseplate hub assembly chaperone [Streptomyces sp. 7N604]|uniref:T4 family baseplate hub assembly chaperone n=1 Tax=Streptomyces sp. 7N604 TaxID=3457415 RepID=UPI003FD2D6E4